MANLRNVQAGEAEALEHLGIRLTRAGDLLTLTFANGQTEVWGRASDYDNPGLSYAELLRLDGRLYVKLPDRES
jgi:hypothetical protein